MFENWDLAQVALYLFWLFFAGLVVYLRREDRREGYPLESDTMPGRLLKRSLVFYPQPKTFALAHGTSGGNTVLRSVPTGLADTRPIAARPMARWPGAPLIPNDPLPLLAGVGPGAWAERPDVPEMTVENHTKIVPMRAAPGFVPASDSVDPRGYTVRGLDRGIAGTVVDVWVDRSEIVARYLEVELAGSGTTGAQPTAGSATTIGQGFEAKAPPVAADAPGVSASASKAPGAPAPDVAPAPSAARSGPRTVLVPITFANISKRRQRVTVKAVLGSQLGMAPRPASPDQVTMLEEEKIVGFFGAGMLYATPRRAEPLL